MHNRNALQSRALLDDTLLPPAAVAELTGLSARTLEGLRRQGRGPAFVKVSARCVRYRYGDLLAWIGVFRRATGEQA